MFDIEFYEDEHGYSETAEWLEELDRKAMNSKQHRVLLKKISEQLQLLKHYGTRIGFPVVRHIEGTSLWELRPMRDRVMFAHIVDNRFIILNHFVKKTQKTPPREIEKAKRMLENYIKREK